MKSSALFVLFAIFGCFCFKNVYAIPVNQPNSFTPNLGQLNFKTTFNELPIDFYLKSKGMNLYFTKSGIIYQLVSAEPKLAYNAKRISKTSNVDINYSCFIYEMKFSNSNPEAKWETEDETEAFSNYYLPSCTNGLTKVKSFSKIILRNIYPHIDWEISSNGTGIKYNFIVHPDGDPTTIEFAFNFADKLSLENKNIKIETQFGNIVEHAPVSYLSDDSKIESSFIQKGNLFAFKLGRYNSKSDLIIDPGVEWSTYFGGSDEDYALDITTDENDNIIICGNTASSNGIFHGGFQQIRAGNKDTFIAKFNSAGNLIWSTYFGGTELDEAFGCSADKRGNIYLAMYTESSSGISYNGFQNNYVLFSDAFLAKFDSLGARVWATYYGNGNEGPMGGVVTDNSDNVYLFGCTIGNQFGRDGFIVKFNTAGNKLWDTYLSGNDVDLISSGCIDLENNLYVSGGTTSTGLFNNGFKDTLSGASDNFIVKYDSLGNKIWGTYYGGSRDDQDRCYCINDYQNNVYLVGNTSSDSQISFNGFQNSINPNLNQNDCYIVKFDSSGNRMWATYLGGNKDDAAYDVTFTNQNHLIVSGRTESDSGFAYLSGKSVIEGIDAFITEFDTAGNRLSSTYFGGPNNEYGSGCTSDTQGNIYIAGETGSTTEIAINAYQNTYAGFGDAFLAKLNCGASTISPIISGNSTPDTFGQFVYTIDTTGVLSYFWEVNGGQIISGQNTDSLIVHWDSIGTETINVYAMYSTGCYTFASMNTLVNSVPAFNQSAFQFYPNPFNDEIYFTGEKLKEIRMADVLSRTIIFTPVENKINTQILSSGIYFLTAIDSKGKNLGTFKMIK